MSTSHELEPDHYAEPVVLVSSGFDFIPINQENAEVYAFGSDPDGIEYCIERQSDNNEKHYVFTDDARVFGVLHQLGYTAILKRFASDDQVKAYTDPANETRHWEWDVLDRTSNWSIYIEQFAKKEQSPAALSIPRETTVVEIQLSEEESVSYSSNNTFLHIYHDYPEMNHVKVIDPDGEWHITFDQESLLIDELTKHQFNTFTGRYPDSKTIEMFNEYQKSCFDEIAEELFDITPPPEEDME